MSRQKGPHCFLRESGVRRRCRYLRPPIWRLWSSVEVHSAKLPRVAEHQHKLFEPDHEMIVPGRSKGLFLGPQLSRHSEVKPNPHPRTEAKQHLLAPRK